MKLNLDLDMLEGKQKSSGRGKTKTNAKGQRVTRGNRPDKRLKPESKKHSAGKSFCVQMSAEYTELIQELTRWFHMESTSHMFRLGLKLCQEYMKAEKLRINSISMKKPSIKRKRHRAASTESAIDNLFLALYTENPHGKQWHVEEALCDLGVKLDNEYLKRHKAGERLWERGYEPISLVEGELDF